jgi:hypothetical protein
MKVTIKNTDDYDTVMITGIKPISGFSEPEVYRYVLRPGEQKEFCIKAKEVLGLENL